MPEFDVIVTCAFRVRARGPNDARKRVESQLDRGVQEIAWTNWYTGPLKPDVEWYIERSDR